MKTNKHKNMKGKISTFMAVAFWLLLIPLNGNAQEKQLKIADLVNTKNELAGELTMVTQEPLSIQKGIKSGHTVSSKAMRSKIAAQKAVNISDLAGTYVQTYKTIATQGADGGCCATISQLGNDSIVITNFWLNGSKIKAGVNVDDGTISIPNQQIGNNVNYGPIDIAVVSEDGTPERSKNIEGTINADGSISITSWWAVFIMEGEHKDGFLDAYNNTVFEKANATMSSHTYKGVNASYGVVVTQSSKNIISVKNFANHGCTVEVVLKSDSTSTISRQTAWKTYQYGNFSTVSAQFSSNGDTLKSYIPTITTGKSDGKKIEWGPWTLLASSAYSSAYDYGAISLDNIAVTFPEKASASLAGSGTLNEPYLIKTIEDLQYLSDEVNSGNKFTGKYFKLNNNIDLANYRFTPIGNSAQNTFGGIFDGGGHTLSNLNVSTSALAGLFGRTDSASVVRNLNIATAKVINTGNLTGTVAGSALGAIENCHVTNTQITASGIGTGGLAGTANTIDNCSVEEATILGAGGYAAGMAGEVEKEIKGSHATGISLVVGGSSSFVPSGVLVGMLYEATASDCYAAGLLDGTNAYSLNLGGLIGTSRNGDVKRCFAVSTIAGINYNDDANIGGLIGQMTGGSLSQSYAQGRVRDVSSVHVGGLTGYLIKGKQQPTISECYTGVAVEASKAGYDTKNGVRETFGTVDDGTTPIAKNVYYDRQFVNYYSEKYVSSTAELTSKSGPEGFNGDNWVFTEGYYPRLKGMENTETSKYSASTLLMRPNNSVDKISWNTAIKALGNTQFYLLKNNTPGSTGNYSRIEGDSLIVEEGFGADTLVIANGRDSRYYIITISPLKLDGAGTIDHPYLISTKEDLIQLSDITTNKNILFPNTYFKVTNDIDLEKDSSFVGICTDAKSANQFEGNIDGDGHTIHNMYLNGVTWQDKPAAFFGDGTGKVDTRNSRSNLGFIGRLSPQGVLKNLTIADDAQLEFFATSGALVGYNYGTIENCINHAVVKGLSGWIGGIAGQSAQGSQITGCLNTGNVLGGYMDAGGICGQTSGTIDNCMNTGEITLSQLSLYTVKTSQMNSAGGITGVNYGSKISNVINSGTISANAQVGGICGTLPSASKDGNNDITFAVNYGTVFSNDAAREGAIGGTSGTQGTIKNVLWDQQLLPLKAHGNADLDGAQGVTTSSLTDGARPEGFADSLWTFKSGSYPVLKSFENDSSVIVSSKIILNFNGKETAQDIKSNVKFTVPAKTTARLLNGNVFKINGNIIIVPDTVTSVISDTIMFSNAKYTKSVLLKDRYELPLQGEGTKDKPFIIATASDWNTFANYMSNAETNFAGQYIKVANDIDFGDTIAAIIGFDGVNFLQGDFDGGGHTVSNIKITPTAQRQGAFATVGENAFIHDLTLQGEVTSNLQYTGGFAGTVAGKVQNCVNKVSVNSSANYAGGFAAYVESSASFINCYNEAEVKAPSYVAGFASDVREGASFNNCGNRGKITNTAKGNYTSGFAASSLPANYIGVSNTGEINLTDAANSLHVAGIIAQARQGLNGNHYIMKGCYNTADITGKGDLSGIISSASAATYIIEMDSCYNTGDIVTASKQSVSNAPTAGIATFYTPGSSYTNCWNKGAIISAQNQNVAGLFGRNTTTPTASSPIVFRGCHNDGDVVADKNTGGGLFGYSAKYMTVDSCYNTGAISGYYGIGGLIGSVAGDTTCVISNCWNSGDIMTSTNRAGGLSGFGIGQVKFINCFNVGDVMTNDTITGTSTSSKSPSGFAIGGLGGNSRAIYINCYNAGTVSGASNIGGLVGNPRKDLTEFHNCYNAGKVTAIDSTSGNIVGTADEKSYMWGDKNVIDNTYYIADLGTLATDTLYGILSIPAYEVPKLAEKLGSDYIKVADNALPVLNGFENNKAAMFGSLFVVPKEGDSFNHITSAFSYTNIGGSEWVSSVNSVTLENGSASFSAPFSGKFRLTANMGSLSKTFELSAVVTDGIGSINQLNGKRVIEENIYSISGMRLSADNLYPGQVYIVERKYDDGSHDVIKAIRK